MRGDLSRTSAADACRELARQGATGLLAIEGPDGPGSVSLIEGRIVAASSPTPRARLGDRLVGASYLDEQDLADALRLQRTGEGHARLGVLLVERGLVSRDAVRLFVQEQMLDALFDVLRWRYGSFEFIAGEATEVLEVPLSIAVDEILVEVARRQQEWEQLSQVIPDLEAVPTFREGASSAAAALEPDEFAVLASVDGERSVRALASDLGYGEFEAARIVYGLCLLGIVEVRLPEDEVGAAFDDAFASGMIHDRPADDDGAVPERDQPDADATAADDTGLSELIAELTDARPEGGDLEPPRDADSQDDADPEPFSAMIDDHAAVSQDWPTDGWESAEPEMPAPSLHDDATAGEEPAAAADDAAADDAAADDVAEDDAAADEPPVADDAPERSGEGDADDTAPPSPPTTGGDVSEFLRELSRLALDGDQPRKPRPSSHSRPADAPRTSSSQREEEKPKKRGLFGWGG